MPLELSDPSKHLLKTLRDEVQTALNYWYGFNGVTKDEEKYKSSIDAANKILEALLSEQKVDITSHDAVAIFLCEADRLDNFSQLLTTLAACPRCLGPFESGHCTIYDEEGNIKRLYCLDCDHSQGYTDFEETGILKSRLHTHVTLDYGYLTGEYDIERLRGRLRLLIRRKADTIHRARGAYNRIEEAAKVFGDAHLQEIQDRSNREDHCGYSTKIGDIEVLTSETAGRRLVTIQDVNDNMLTLITDASNVSRHGVQGVYGTADNVVTMVNRLMAQFSTDLLKKSNSIFPG